jgi:hypothetical protein
MPMLLCFVLVGEEKVHSGMRLLVLQFGHFDLQSAFLVAEYLSRRLFAVNCFLRFLRLVAAKILAARDAHYMMPGMNTTTEKNYGQVLRWGIIGCGDVTEVKSGPAYQQTEGFELIAVCRRNEEKVKDYAQRHGVTKYYSAKR